MQRLALPLLLAFVVLEAAAQAASSHSEQKLSRELLDYLKRPEAQVRVLHGALLLCKHAHPELNLEAERASFKKLSTEFAATLKSATSIRQQSDALAQFLFSTQQFGLPERDDASAFLLSDVSRNKRGNCLGLSVLCLALAEETGLRIFGVPVPSRSSESGHMFVRFDDGNVRRNFDPAQHGIEHADAYYHREFKLTDADLRAGYVLGNAKRRDVLALMLVNLGGAYLDDNCAPEAIPLLEAALSIRSESAATHSNLAGARLISGDTLGAEKEYAAALKIDPNFFPARIGQADLALRKSDPNAEKLIDAALAIEPENVQAKTMLATLQLQRHDLAGALKTLNDLSALPTADVTVWNNLGRCNAMNGDVALSEISFRRALMYDDRSADAHCGLGRALALSGKKPEALAEFEAALKLDPRHADAKAALAELGQPVAAKPNEPPAAAVQKPQQLPPGTTALPFKIVSNRIFVTIRLNDKVDAEAIVDTGAEVSMLNSARVKLDGLKPVGAENLLGNMVGRVAVQTVALDALQLGDTIVRKQPVARMEQGPGTKFELIDFVLGMDVLSRSRFTLDFERSLLLLEPPNSKPTPPAANAERIEIRLVPPPGASLLRPFIVASANKNTATFLLDTGADAPMAIAFKKPSELGFTITEPPAGKARIYEGNTQTELSVYSTVFSSLEVNKAIFKNVDGRVLDGSSINSPVIRQNLAFMNVLGTPFFQKLLALHIDIASGTVFLDRPRQ